MKKSFILGIIIGGIIFGSSVFAISNYLYSSNEVSYTPSDTTWNVSDVKDALNDLHDKVKNYIPAPSGNKQITISSTGTSSAVDVTNYATATCKTSGLYSSCSSCCSSCPSTAAVFLHQSYATTNHWESFDTTASNGRTVIFDTNRFTMDNGGLKILKSGYYTIYLTVSKGTYNQRMRVYKNNKSTSDTPILDANSTTNYKAVHDSIRTYLSSGDILYFYASVASDYNGNNYNITILPG